MIVAGLDVSTKLLACVLIDGETGDLVAYETFPLKTSLNVALRSRDKAVAEIAYFLDYWGCTFPERRTDLLYIEQPMGPHVRSIAAIERIIGACIARTYADVNLVSPTEWKKAAGLPGNADKALIAQTALEHYPCLAGQPQDIYDAALIARAGMAINARAFA